MKFSEFKYEETPLVELLVLSSFLYILNVFGWITERLLHAGLIAQIATGIIYGPPLANIIPHNWLSALQALGNLGLILLIFQGGLSTRLDLLKANIVLSISVALVGILVPIGLSLVCFVFVFGATPLQGFIAGAALCSTSLGTTFAMLSSFKSSPDLRNTRIGNVLLSAAILDDVVGLIMASVVSQVTAPGNQMHGKHLAWTILQPPVASVGMVGGALVVVRWVLVPVYRKIIVCMGMRMSRGYFLLAMTAVVSGLVSISNFTGSSMLFGAYVAGCILQFLDSSTTRDGSSSFKDAFDTHVGPLSDLIFVPLFFSSIGTAIPFLSLWKGSVVWKGAVYASLMCVGKAATGICILVWPNQVRLEGPGSDEERTAGVARSVRTPLGEEMSLSTSQMQPHTASPISSKKVKRQMPVYPALFISLAMVSRGEIALLIAQIGLPTLGEENFLVVMWAAVLCTLVGAVTTGQLVHRQFLECTRGIWG